jgi:hypothetical protein
LYWHFGSEAIDAVTARNARLAWEEARGLGCSKAQTCQETSKALMSSIVQAGAGKFLSQTRTMNLLVGLGAIGLESRDVIKRIGCYIGWYLKIMVDNRRKHSEAQPT